VQREQRQAKCAELFLGVFGHAVEYERLVR
jgi:hypothetical protein